MSTNYERAFAARPDVYAAWQQLNAAVRANMDPRRYELATVAAARELRSSYCTLAHGEILAEHFLGADAVRALVAHRDTSAIDEAEEAVMDLAEQVVEDATAVTERDLDRLRGLGLSDAEILDVILAAAMRCFFSKTLDALDVKPDARFAGLDPGLREALTVGRPIED